MAIDVYLQIDGIKGESQDSAHQGWIECSSVNWGMSQPKSATSSTAGDHTAERVEFTEIGINRTADLASPILAQHCAMGKTIPKAKLEFMRADGDGKPVKYYEVELENVLIAKCQQGVSAGDVMQEHIGLKFSKVKWKYSQQRIAGGSGGNTAAAGIWRPQPGSGMRPLLLMMAVLAAQASAAPAYRAHTTGAQLVRDMLADPFQGANSMKRERAMGYIEGVADASAGVRWCPAGKPVPHELPYIVVEEMEKAGQLEGDASVLVLTALGRLFPCRAGDAR